MATPIGMAQAVERLRVALDAGDVGTWEWNVATGHVTWTDTLERIHGFRPGSFGGTFDVYQSYIHEDDRATVLAAIQRAVAEKIPYDVEYRMHKQDGTLHWVTARGRVFTDDEGRPLTMMGICQDITERRRAEDAVRLLSDSSKVLASSLDYEKTLTSVARLSVPHLGDWCLVHVLEDDGRLHRVAMAHGDPTREQQAAEIAERYPSATEASNGPQRVIRTGAIEFVPDLSLDLLRANAHDDQHLQLLAGLGMRSYICLPLLARGRTLGTLTLITAESRRAHDSHDLRLAEELAARAALAIDNARLYQRSVEASRAKDEFLAMLSHELRSPITAVLGFAALLEQGGLTETEMRSAIESIKASAQGQARLVEDILEVSREAMGKVRLAVSPMDVAIAARLAAGALSPAARAKGVRITHGTMDHCLVQADPDRMQQVLWNLTTNALKFTPPGGEISIEVRRESDVAAIEVRDTGIGIAPDFLPQVFERFTQASSSRDQGGLGLGLAIVRHLVDLHGGTVEARSDGPGAGAAFIVRLPLLAEAEPAESLPTPSPQV